MQATVTLNDELIKEAIESTGTQDLSELLNEALRSLIYRQTARQLIALGGSQPDLQDIPRRRPAA